MVNTNFSNNTNLVLRILYIREISAISVRLCHNIQIDASISALASSTSEDWMERRYIWVVVSELCPNASLIMEIEMFLSLAVVAHEWRAT